MIKASRKNSFPQRIIPAVAAAVGMIFLLSCSLLHIGSKPEIIRESEVTTVQDNESEAWPEYKVEAQEGETTIDTVTVSTPRGKMEAVVEVRHREGKATATIKKLKTTTKDTTRTITKIHDVEKPILVQAKLRGFLMWLFIILFAGAAGAVIVLIIIQKIKLK